MAPSFTSTDGAEPTLDAMYRAAVGPKHTDFYVGYFTRRDAGGGGFISWNWPALFIQFFWSIYRKMWGFALGALALQFAASFILIVAFLVLSDMLMPGATSAHTDSTARWIGLLDLCCQPCLPMASITAKSGA